MATSRFLSVLRGGRASGGAHPPAFAIRLTRTTALAALAFTGPTTVAVEQFDLPELGDRSEQVLTPQMERKIGRIVLRRIQSSVMEDQLVEHYLQELGKRIAVASGSDPRNYTFALIDDERINAFAAPGGIIGLNTGIFLKAENVDEVAAVLAHEVAHVTQRHIARQYGKRKYIGAQTIASFVAAILLSNIDPELGRAAITIGAGGALQYQINYTRQNEKEADDIGMQYLVKAGFNPNGMPRFFERLLRATQTARSALPEYLRTHPLTQNRVAESHTRAQSYPEKTFTDDLDFEIAKVRIRLNTEEGSWQPADHFRERLENEGEKASPHRLNAWRYGYILALLEIEKYGEAERHLNSLLADGGGRLPYLLAAARLEMLRGNEATGLDLLDRAQALYPDHPDPILQKALFYLHLEQADLARQSLREYGRFRTDMGVRYYELLAQAENLSGFPIESDLALAEVAYLKGSTKKAIAHLRTSLNRPTLTDYQRKRLGTRLKQLENEYAIEEALKI